MNTYRPIMASLLRSLVFFFLAGTGWAQVEGLGTIDFPTSGAPPAQEHFLKGALLLHSFEYDDARQAFQEAQRIDPDFGMAFWGEAMTHNRPIWMEQDLEQGRQVLKRLGETPESRLSRFGTAREQTYLRAVEILFGEGDKLTRDLAYVEAMRQLAQDYPNDLNAASFYALALLGSSQKERDFALYMRAAAAAEEVFSRNPRHPGAAHYLIHSYDDPIHAPLGLRAARVYANIAPAAAHAQHMPSHIFLALGMWEEVVRANQASFKASDARISRKGLTTEDRGYHALRWLQYAYLQQGRYRDAGETLQIMRADVEKTGSPRTRSNLVFMRAVQLIETQDWNGEAAVLPVDLSGLTQPAVATHLFATGFNAIQNGDLAATRKALEGLTREAGGATKLRPDQRLTVEIMEKELHGLLRLAQGKIEQALGLLEEAVDLEDRMSLQFGPPTPVKPAREVLGEVLLELKRPQRAQGLFQQALARAPRRALLLLGLGRSALASGDTQVALSAHRELADMWQQTDPKPPLWTELQATLRASFTARPAAIDPGR